MCKIRNCVTFGQVNYNTISLQVVLRDLAQIHSLYLNNREWLSAQPWLEWVNGKQMTEMAPLWRELVHHAHSEFPKFWSRDRLDLSYYVCITAVCPMSQYNFLLQCGYCGYSH